MTYSRFEDLPVWQAATRLSEGVWDMIEGRDWRGIRNLWNQIERAALSVSNSIAETRVVGDLSLNPAQATLRRR